MSTSQKKNKATKSLQKKKKTKRRKQAKPHKRESNSPERPPANLISPPPKAVPDTNTQKPSDSSPLTIPGPVFRAPQRDEKEFGNTSLNTAYCAMDTNVKVTFFSPHLSRFCEFILTTLEIFQLWVFRLIISFALLYT